MPGWHFLARMWVSIRRNCLRLSRLLHRDRASKVEVEVNRPCGSKVSPKGKISPPNKGGQHRPTNTGPSQRRDLIPTHVLHKLLFPQKSLPCLTYTDRGPRPRKPQEVISWKECIYIPCLRFHRNGFYRGTRYYRVKSVRPAHGLDFLDYQVRGDRKIDRLRRTMYASSALVSITGHINHDFLRGLTLVSKGYFDVARKCFRRFNRTVKSMYKLSTDFLGLLLSMIYRGNNACMQFRS